MRGKEIIKKIESKNISDKYNHYYSELLLKTENSENHRKYLWSKYVNTGDGFYAFLVKWYS